MRAQKRVFLLIIIMAITTLGIEALAINLLYSTAVQEQRTHLIETVRSQARLMEAVARFDSSHNTNYPMGARAATLNQIIDAHNNYKGFGKTGEFTIARRINGYIEFLFSHRGHMDNDVKPVAWNSNRCEPMHRALSGQSGSMIGLDYKGDLVLAAYEPVDVLNVGIVAKINVEELRAPFIRVGLICAMLGVIAVVIGAGLFMHITNPMIRKLEDSVNELNAAMLKVKQLSGFLHICSNCKRIYDDEEEGWKRLEEYISAHSEADFSHGICPQCARKLYPDLLERNDKKNG